MQYLSFLWMAAAESRPDGHLTGWDNEDIAMACEYDGDSETIVSALKTARWLDGDLDTGFSLHDWGEWQPWAAGALARSEQSRKAAETRWQNAGSNESALPNDADSINQHCPLPYPSLPNLTLPNPTKEAAAAAYLGRALKPIEQQAVDAWPYDLETVIAAVKEASLTGGKSLKYVQRILDRQSQPQKDRYKRGKFGHMVQQ